MRVLCINEKWNYASTAPRKEHPNYGNVDVVIREQIVHFTDKPGYILERFPDLCFAQECFIPLSDNEEIANEKTVMLEIENQ